MRVGRPRTKDAPLYRRRNGIIIGLISEGYTQSQVARIFNLPRNTIYQVKNKKI